MRVQIIQSIAGHADPRYNLPDFGFRPGEVTEIHDTLAGHWIASGVAEAAPAAAKTPKPAKASKIPEVAPVQEGE